MILSNMKSYNAETRSSGLDEYGQPRKTFDFYMTVEVSVSLLNKVINDQDPRYMKATHLGLTYDKTLKEGMRLVYTDMDTNEDTIYMIKLVNNDGRMSQLTLEVI